MNSFIRPKIEACLRDPLSRGDYITLCRKLWEAQHGKCYLCGRRLETDINLEHFKPVAAIGGRIYRWDNLMLSCSYCNSVKGSRDWRMPDPTRCDIFGRLIQFYNPVSHKVQIHCIVRGDTASLSARRLLLRIFNGTPGSEASLRLENFRRHLREVMESFERFLREITAAPAADGDIDAELDRRLSSSAEFIPFIYTRFCIWEKWFMELKPGRRKAQTPGMVQAGYRALCRYASAAANSASASLMLG